MDLSELDGWLPPAKRQAIITQLTQRIGLTRVRAECFLRLWLYLLYKEQQTTAQRHKLPLQQLVRPSGEITCTLREARVVLSRQRPGERSRGWHDAQQVSGVRTDQKTV